MTKKESCKEKQKQTRQYSVLVYGTVTRDAICTKDIESNPTSMKWKQIRDMENLKKLSSLTWDNMDGISR